jgi:hypothetical protein
MTIWILRHPVQSLSVPLRVWLTRVYTLRLNQGKQNWGKTRCFQAFFLDQDKPNQGRKVKRWRPRQKESTQESQTGSWWAGFPTGRGFGHSCGLRLRGVLPPPQEPPRPCSGNGGNCPQEPVLSEAKDCAGCVPHVKVQSRLPGCQCSEI